eukprot:Nitzschia sp. Nitz4//scaffold373_size14178//11733//14141//NITZ4_008955-RA/size14178-processed-gene-0.3-mRNA-1//1//CDS//3329549610//6901//frame0
MVSSWSWSMRRYASYLPSLMVLSVIIFVSINMSCLELAMMHLKPNEGIDYYNTYTDHVFGTDFCTAFGNIFLGTTKYRTYGLYGTAVPILFSVPLGYWMVGSKWFRPPTNAPPMNERWCWSWFKISGGGDANIQRWTYILLLVPCVYVLYLTAVIGRSKHFEWLDFFEMTILYSGDVAVMSLAFFLVPVAKHSVWLECLRMDTTHALTFHRLAGWISFVLSMYHGIFYCYSFGERGVEQGDGFWNGMWDTIIPPLRCWEWDALFSFRNLTASNACQGYYMNFTGVISLVAFIILAAMSLPKIRRAKYAWFYDVHIIMGWTMMVFALLHFATDGYYIFPGIVYYIACSVPVWVQQFLDSRKQQGVLLSRIRKINDSNECLELEFCAEPRIATQKTKPHVFIKLCVPEISSQWHPFSTIVFLPKNAANCSSEDLQPKVRVLFRATGPFTKSLSQRLSRTSEDQSSSPVGQSTTNHVSTNVLVDAFYPEGQGWMEAITHGQHDSAVMIAGGVGIVPFLSLIPDILSERREENNPHDPENELQSILCTSEKKKLVLHWYCREPGLARYVQEEYFDKWADESHLERSTSRFEVQIEIHITSLSGPSSGDNEGMVVRVSDVSPTEEPLFIDLPGHNKDSSRKLVSPSRWKATQEDKGALLRCAVVGGIGLLGWIFHTWIYEEVIMNHLNLTSIRIVPLMVVFLAAFVLSFIGERILSNTKRQEQVVLATDFDDACLHERACGWTPHDVAVHVRVSRGRPSCDLVFETIREAENPAVFLCGPSKLRHSIKHAIQNRHACCAVYESAAEM